MQALRKIVNVSGASLTVDLPADWHLTKAEVIVLPVGDEVTQSESRESWETFVKRTMGSIPDFPDRFPQGDYEIRKGFDD
jgi:virulence-associated protein VagC